MTEASPFSCYHFKNSFNMVQLMYNKLHVLNIYNLMFCLMFTPWSHHHNQDSDRCHLPQKFPPTPAPQPQAATNLPPSFPQDPQLQRPPVHPSSGLPGAALPAAAVSLRALHLHSSRVIHPYEGPDTHLLGCNVPTSGTPAGPTVFKGGRPVHSLSRP